MEWNQFDADDNKFFSKWGSLGMGLFAIGKIRQIFEANKQTVGWDHFYNGQIAVATEEQPQMEVVGSLISLKEFPPRAECSQLVVSGSF